MADSIPGKTPGTINIPKIGRVKKVYVYGGVAVVGILVIVYYRNHAASSSASTDASQQTDPAGNVGVIDPATGYVEGSPEDLSALTASADFNPAGDSSQGSAGSVDTQIDNGPPFTSNAAWSQYVLAHLPQAQDDPSGVASALGAYLAGSKVTPAQHDLIQAAIALADRPPVSGPNGMPPAINVGAPLTGGQIPPPLRTPPTAPRPVDLTHTNITATSVDLHWTEVPGATGYHVYRGHAVTGENTHIGTAPASARSFHVAGLHPNTLYTFFVQPWGSVRALESSNEAIIRTRS